MQIINKILNENTTWTPFFWIQYLPNWISPIWFYLVIWYFIIFISIDWKNDKIKWTLAYNRGGEDMYFLIFAVLLYSFILFYYYGLFKYIILSIILLFDCFLFLLNLFAEYLFETNIELDNKFSLFHKFSVFWTEFLEYLMK